jgi:hypothetical protein
MLDSFQVTEKVERETGFEPATSSLGNQQSIDLSRLSRPTGTRSDVVTCMEFPSLTVVTAVACRTVVQPLFSHAKRS